MTFSTLPEKMRFYYNLCKTLFSGIIFKFFKVFFASCAKFSCRLTYIFRRAVGKFLLIHIIFPFFYLLVLKKLSQNFLVIKAMCRSMWPPGLKRGSAAARLLGLRFRIPPVTWMSVCCDSCASSGRGLCDGLITRPKDSYQVWCVDWVWSWIPVRGCQALQKEKYKI
jgi:hypothetical protein